MKRMTRKLYGILILSMLATSAHGGWLSNLGQRIVNGAANTVQNNISGKVNKTIDDVMDGKIQTNKGKKGNSMIITHSLSCVLPFFRPNLFTHPIICFLFLSTLYRFSD